MVTLAFRALIIRHTYRVYKKFVLKRLAKLRMVWAIFKLIQLMKRNFKRMYGSDKIELRNKVRIAHSLTFAGLMMNSIYSESKVEQQIIPFLEETAFRHNLKAAVINFGK